MATKGWHDAEGFYDALADDYHLIFEDWWTAAEHHGQIVRQLLQRYGVTPPARILDCTCGIGTQALPLARAGYRVVGTDLSEQAVTRAGREAAARGIAIQLTVADVRELDAHVNGPFDAVISFDNSLPHLLTEAGLVTALRQISATLAPAGMVAVSVRDYDALAAERPTGTMPRLYRDAGVAGDAPEGGTRITGQAWEWDENGTTVDLHLFVLTEQDGAWDARVHTTTYRAWRRHELDAALARAGFTDTAWYDPAESGYYQPIVVARKPR